MHRTIYLHQFDQLGEQSVAEIAATLRLGGLDEVRVKTHQFTTWTGYYDTSPLKINALDDVRQRRDQFAAEGIQMHAWCVPMGLDLAAEAAFTVQVAALLGNAIELDIEPYAGFWDGEKAGLLPYVQRLKTAGLAVAIDFDARSGGYTPFPQMGAALALADSVWTQSYWTDFGQHAVVVVAEAIQTLGILNVATAKRGVILPSDGAADYPEVCALLEANLIQQVGVWRMGAAGPQVYTALAAIPTLQPASAVTVPPEWQQYGKTWEEVARTVKSVADDALATGRKMQGAATAVAKLWGNR